MWRSVGREINSKQKRIEFQWHKLEDNEARTRKIGLERIENH